MLEARVPHESPSSAGFVLSATHGGLPAYSILQPRERDDEQRREDHTEERVDPDEADVEAAESETDPESAQWSVSFQESAPVAVNPTR